MIVASQNRKFKDSVPLTGQEGTKSYVSGYFISMTLVTALALSPALMTLIMQPASGWGRREQLAYMTSFAMTFWTPILALIALVGDRSRRQSRRRPG